MTSIILHDTSLNEILSRKDILDGSSVFSMEGINIITEYYTVYSGDVLEASSVVELIENPNKEYWSSMPTVLAFLQNRNWNLLSFEDFETLYLNDKKEKEKREKERIRKKNEELQKEIFDHNFAQLSEDNKIAFFKAQKTYPDLLIDINRWKKVKFFSKMANKDVNGTYFDNACGCCSDSPVLAHPFIELEENCFVYSSPYKITIGEGIGWFSEYGFVADDGYCSHTKYCWEDVIKENEINPIISEQIQTHVEFLKDLYKKD